MQIKSKGMCTTAALLNNYSCDVKQLQGHKSCTIDNCCTYNFVLYGVSKQPMLCTGNDSASLQLVKGFVPG